jgi:hypothetical protein
MPSPSAIGFGAARLAISFRFCVMRAARVAPPLPPQRWGIWIFALFLGVGGRFPTSPVAISSASLASFGIAGACGEWPWLKSVKQTERPRP